MYAQEITWTLADGREARVEVGLVTEERWRDDWGEEHAKPACRLRVSGNIGGGVSYERLPQPVTLATGKVCVAKVGQLGVSEPEAARIEAAIRTVEQSPEMAAHEQRRAKAELEQDEYWATRERIERAMRGGE